MKLLLHKNLQSHKELIKCVFDVVTRELGIADLPNGVRFHAAYCEGAAGDTENWLTKGNASVRIDTDVAKIDDDAIVQVFSHELVHVKQLLKDGLGCVCKMGLMSRLHYGPGALLGHGIVFKGKMYPDGNKAAQMFGDFSNTPWEIEAYGKNVELMDKVSDEWVKRHPGAGRFKENDRFKMPDGETVIIDQIIRRIDQMIGKLQKS